MRNYLQNFDADIKLQGKELVYRFEDKTARIPVSEIQLIGEYSSEPGTYIATYFFSFKFSSKPDLLDIPAETEGLFETLQALSELMPQMGKPKLQMSTDFDSNVLFPASLQGIPYYSFEAKSRPLVNLPIFREMIQVEEIDKSVVMGVVPGFN